MSQANKCIHFLISGTVSFVDHSTEETATRVNHLNLNGILIQDQESLPVASLSKAQQILQLEFFKQVGEEGAPLQVVAVLLNNFVRLGEFTQEEWVKQVKDAAPTMVITGGDQEPETITLDASNDTPTSPGTGKDNPFASDAVVLPGGGEVKPE